MRILIANRGEIAVRLQSSISVLGHEPIGVYTQDEGPHAAHLCHLPVESRFKLPGETISAWLDVDSLLTVAKQASADAVHPGYGFLSESAHFASAVLATGFVWIGPSPDVLKLFGDKQESKAFATRCGISTLPASRASSALSDIQSFAQEVSKNESKIVLKALQGGGGRGIRVVHQMASLEDDLRSCQREAFASSGSNEVFAELYLPKARHIEVQMVGDKEGNVRHVGERECSLQRRHQKIVEFCPSPTLVHLPRLRASILAAATTLCQRAKLDSLATVEFLVVEPELSSSKEGHYYFLEANPRLQVEHTVTEQAFGLDLVAVQIEAAFGRTLGTLRWPTNASRCSIQLRLNAERFSADGTWVPTVGSVSAFSPPTGPFVRVDTALHAPLPVPVGLYRQTLLYDSLLAKIIVTGSSYKVTVSAAIRALEQMFLEGVSTNRELLLSLMRHPAVASNTGIHTRFIDDIAEELSATSQGAEAAPKVALTQASQVPHEPSPEQGTESAALLVPPGHQCLYGTLPGKVIKIECVVGDEIAVADQIALLESMKMEHTVRATVSGVVKSILCRPGDILKDGDPIILLDLTRDPSRSPTARLAPKEVTMSETSTDTASDTDAMEALQAIRAQRDDSHPLRQHLVARRHRKSYRTAQENLTSLLDIEKLDIEYGDLAVAAQRTRLDSEGLARTRGDGVVTGFGRVNSSVLPGSVRERDRQARCAVVMYDYTVLADTQGYFHHSKIDRLFAQVLSNPCPLILYAEGGGGRPADVDAAHIKIAGLDTHSFPLLAEISARGIPIVGVANGYTFAGNAALLGTSDIVIATKNSSTGFGGPAMIEGGGLGKVRPDQIGPPSSHLANGNIDILVDDEEEATEVVQKVVSFWQGETIFEPSRFPKKDRRALRGIIPASTRRAYDVRDILNLLADTEFLEIGKMWGKSLTCGFLRIEGRPLAVIASNVSSELGGAIDAASAKKATRFVRLLSKTRCAHLVALCDTPGFLVGSSAEKDPLGALRAFPEYFAACAAFRGVGGGQIFGLTLKRGVGLGAQAVLGGSTLSNLHSVAWPGAAFAAMGIQGAVRLGWSKQLSACRSEEEREEMERKLVQELTNRGDAVRMAEAGEIDTVIDPAETHDWLKYCLDAAPQRRGITEQAHRMRYKERL